MREPVQGSPRRGGSTNSARTPGTVGRSALVTPEEVDVSGDVGGCFFTVDARIWPRVCALGMNAAVSYLVLATGTGKDMAHTTWSVHAVEKYTGISRLRAAAAIRRLIDAGFVADVVVKKTSRPVYRLCSAAECLSERTKQHSRESDAPADLTTPNWIWLPNALVTGAGDETPPLELLRETNDVLKLGQFVALYGLQHLRVEGGVSREFLWEGYKRSDLGTRGEFRVWGFHQPVRYMRLPSGVISREGIEDDAGEFFGRLKALEEVGLVEFVPHLVEGPDNDAEIMHPYGTGASDGIEDRLGSAASEAAYALLTKVSEAWATRFHVAPVLRHMSNVQMIGIARLRYKPWTRSTAAWQANASAKAERYLAMYSAIILKAKS